MTTPNETTDPTERYEPLVKAGKIRLRPRNDERSPRHEIDSPDDPLDTLLTMREEDR